jgi:SAM-dependent methyltransferase
LRDKVNAMFVPDVSSLRQYYATLMGERSQALIAEALVRLWPTVKGDAVLTIGYAMPYVNNYLPQAAPLLACMPAQQGAICWPTHQHNRVFLAHESELPLQENSINRVLLIHSMEHSEQLSWMMREIWRVLTPGGRVLAIAPNRLSLWSRSSRTPFGYGRPFSNAQLRDLLASHQFTPTRSDSALFMPPTRIAGLWKIAPKIEKLGRYLCPFLGGVLLMEAEKQIYAAIKQPVLAKKGFRVPLTAPQPVMGKSPRSPNPS